MPNHVDHDMWISGPREAVERLLKECLTDNGAIDANALIPYPEKYRELDRLAEEWAARYRDVPREQVPWQDRPTDGYNSGGYEWCIDNWGTKWGTYDGRGVEEIPQPLEDRMKVKLGFQTAWSPALPVYEALAARYPDCTIVVHYYECGMGFRGRLRYRRGALVADERGSYAGRRGG